jgi:hypothetical protein
MSPLSRREFLGATAASAATLAFPQILRSADRPDALAAIQAEIVKRHGEGVARLQEWVRQPSIAAENRGMSEGCELMMRFAREAGFQQVTRIPTDGQPGVFATLDTGAARTVGLYFMYDVKQVDPAEWSSPPWEAALVDKPGFGKVLMGRGAVNQKGPEAAFLAALHAIHGAGRKCPVNLVLVAEGEEEIGSPHFRQVVHRPEVIVVDGGSLDNTLTLARTRGTRTLTAGRGRGVQLHAGAQVASGVFHERLGSHEEDVHTVQPRQGQIHVRSPLHRPVLARLGPVRHRADRVLPIDVRRVPHQCLPGIPVRTPRL